MTTFVELLDSGRWLLVAAVAFVLVMYFFGKPVLDLVREIRSITSGK